MARFSNPFSQFFSDSGRILPGAQLFFYVNGTTTPQATYEDAAFTVVNPNPVICGSNGRVPDIFMPDNLVYSITLTDTNGVQIDQADDITGSDSQVSSEEVLAALAANTDPVVINGSSATINANTTINGNQTITGTLGVTGALTASGGVDGVLGGVTPAAVSGTTGSFNSTFDVTTTQTGNYEMATFQATGASGNLVQASVVSTAANSNVGWNLVNDAQEWSLQLKGASSDVLAIRDMTAGSDLVTIAPSTGNATFSGDVTVNDFMVIGGGNPTGGGDLIISSGAITATSSYHRVDTEGATPTDDLVTINGGSSGKVLILRTVSSSRDIVIKNGTGNITTPSGADVTLSTIRDVPIFMYDGVSNVWRLTNE